MNREIPGQNQEAFSADLPERPKSVERTAEIVDRYRAGRLELLSNMGNRVAGEIWAKIPEAWHGFLKESLSLGLNWAPLVGDVKMLRAMQTGKDMNNRSLSLSDKLLYGLNVSCSAISWALVAYLAYIKLSDGHADIIHHPGALAAGGLELTSQVIQGLHTSLRSINGLKTVATGAGFASAAWMLEKLSSLSGEGDLTILKLQDHGQQ